MTGEHNFKRATVTVELYDGRTLTLELNDDPDGTRLDGEITVDTGARQVKSDLPWVVREPGASTASVRLSGPGGFVTRRDTGVASAAKGYGVPPVQDPNHDQAEVDRINRLA